MNYYASESSPSVYFISLSDKPSPQGSLTVAVTSSQLGRQNRFPDRAREKSSSGAHDMEDALEDGSALAFLMFLFHRQCSDETLVNSFRRSADVYYAYVH